MEIDGELPGTFSGIYEVCQVNNGTAHDLAVRLGKGDEM